MPDLKPKLVFDVAARRIDAHGSVATCTSASTRLDTDLAGNPDAFNPAELLLAALAGYVAQWRGSPRPSEGVTPSYRIDPITSCMGLGVEIPS